MSSANSKAIAKPDSIHEVYDAEICVLGSMLIAHSSEQGQLINSVRATLISSEVFEWETNRLVYECICDLHDRNEPIDLITVKDELGRRGILEKIGGARNLANLLETVPSPINAVHYAKIVKDYSIRRIIQNRAVNLQKLSRSLAPLEQVVDAALNILGPDESSSESRRMMPLTSAELMKLEIPPTRYIVEKYVPAGLTMLVGKGKIGKSWLVLGLAVAVSCGGYFISEHQRVPKTGVLYLALEDSHARLQERLRSMLGDTPAPSNLYFTIGAPQMNDAGIATLRRWLSDHPDVGLVIIDTMGVVRPAVTRNTILYQDDTAFLRPLKELADTTDTGVLVVHHSNKIRDAEDWTDTISGSTGLLGVVDTIIGLFRKRGDSQATLRITGRDSVDGEIKEQMEFSELGMRWVSLGNADEYTKTTELDETIIAIKNNFGSREFMPKDLLNILEDITADNARQRCVRLLKAGHILHVPGKYGRYKLNDAEKSDVTVSQCHTSTDSSTKTDTNNRDRSYDLSRALPFNDDHCDKPIQQCDNQRDSLNTPLSHFTDPISYSKHAKCDTVTKFSPYLLPTPEKYKELNRHGNRNLPN